MLMSFAGTRYIFRGLGGDALGLIIFTLTLSAILRSVLELGICSTVVREVATHRTDEPDYVNDVIRMSSLLYWTAFAALSAGAWFGAPAIVSYWIHLRTVDRAVAVEVVRILGCAAFLALPRALYGSVLRGLERMELNNGVDAAVSVLQQAGTIAAVALGGSLLTVSYWVAGCFAASIFLYLWILTRLLPSSAFVPAWIPSVVRRNREFSGRMMWISLLTLAHSESDKMLVSKFLPIAETGFYGFAASLTMRAGVVASSISTAAFPSLSSVLNQYGLDAAARQYRKLHDLVCFGTVPLFAGIAFVAPWLFTFMFNASAARSLMPATILLCFATYLNCSLNMPYIMSLACGRPGIALKSASMALCITLPGSVYLVYRFGLSGAGWSWLFYQIFACAYAIPDFCDCLGISSFRWYWHLARILTLAAGTYGAAGAALAFSGVSSLQGAALGYAAASISFAVGSYALVGEEFWTTLVELTKSSLRFSRAAAM